MGQLTTIEPEVSEAVGGIEIYCDGAIVRLTPEIATVICYRNSPDHPEVLRIYMPISGFGSSLLNALLHWKNFMPRH